MSITAITALSAAGALAGAIGGAVRSAQFGEQSRKLIQDQRNENRRWYDRRMAEDYTMRSDAQALLKRQRELLDEQYKRAKATNVVAGGTDESLALQKQAANKSLSDTMTNIAANASAHKDNIEAQYRAQDAALNQQQAADLKQQSANAAQAGGQMANAGLNLMGNTIASQGTAKADFLKSLSDSGTDWQSMSEDDLNALFKKWNNVKF